MQWRYLDGMVVQQVELPCYRSRVSGFILNISYCLCGVLDVLSVSVWVFSGFAGFFHLGVLADLLGLVLFSKKHFHRKRRIDWQNM